MVAVALWLVPVIFGAGAAWKTLRDLKGVSGKVNNVKDKNDSRYLTLCIVILQALPEKDRASWAAVLHQGR
jgi:hypothetical protein